jgi:hypothetical protein
MVAPTSIENYHLHKDLGRLGSQARAVMDFIFANPGKDFSRVEISEHLQMRLSSVCGRVNELLDDGFLKPAQSRKCSITGKTICPITLQTKQLEMEF